MLRNVITLLGNSELPGEIPRTKQALTQATLVATRIGLTIAGFVVFDRLVADHAHKVGAIPTASVTYGFFTALSYPGYALLAVLAVVSAVSGHWKATWEGIGDPGALRWITGICAVLLAWNFSTSEFNFYLNEAQVLDRILVIGFAVGVLWRPIFALPLLFVVLAFRGQFVEPIGGYFPAETLPLVAIIQILVVRLALSSILGKRRLASDVLLLALCIQASCYLVPGLSKVMMGWIVHDQTNLLSLHAFARGWASWIGIDDWLRFNSLLAAIDLPTRIGVVLVECGAICVLFRRNIACCMMVAWLVFMVGLAATIGYVFLYWSILTISLLVISWRPKVYIPFGVTAGLIGMGAVGLSIFWLKPANLAWLDTRMSYAFEFEAVDDTGTHHKLSPRFFRPYSDAFTMASFEFLKREPQLVYSYGITGDPKIVRALSAAQNAGDVFALEAQSGKYLYRESRVERFDAFVRAFFSNYAARSGNRGFWASVHPPPILHAYPLGADADLEARVVRVEIFHSTWFFDGQSLQKIRRELVYSINIPAPSGETHSEVGQR